MDIKNEIESIIFLSNTPITIKKISDYYNISEDDIMTNILELKENRKDTGINIEIDGDKIFLITNPYYGETIKDFFEPELIIRKLSKSSMEVLTIIAYKGAITKSELENIRGIGCDNSIDILLTKKLIYISGKKTSPGRPNLYEVTDNFYAYLGLKDKNELYELDDNNYIEKLEILNKKEEDNNEIK